MRRLLAGLAGVALLTACSTGPDAVDVTNGGEFRFVAGTPAGEVIPVDDRARAPEFSGTLLGGGTFRSDELAGDVAVLNFWGSWCPPCRVETPQFQEVYAEVRDRGVAFLGLDVKEADEQFALAFVESEGIEFPSLYDPRVRWRWPSGTNRRTRCRPPSSSTGRGGWPRCTPVRSPRTTCAR